VVLEPGKVYVVDFWATWDEPYKAEAANTLVIQERWKGRLEVIGVSLDNDRAAMDAFAKDLPWRQVFPGNGLGSDVAKAWGVERPSGLRILVLGRPAVPTAAFGTAVNVGSADEFTGETGLAHMFEHMDFKGTSTVGTKDAEKEKAALDDVEKAFAVYRKCIAT